MKNTILRALLKFAIVTILILNLIVLTSCGGSRGWSCKKRYVYVTIDKEYIKNHQSGADSFDKLMLNKKVNPKI